jgi:hypothetical protein
MSKTYCVRLPLEFPGSYNIQQVDPPAEAKILDHASEFSRGVGNYVLTVKGVGSLEEAHEILRRIHAGVYWAGLELKTGIKMARVPQSIHYHDDPDKIGKNLMLQGPVDAVIDTAQPAVYCEDKHIARMSAYPGSVITGIKAERFLQVLSRGLEQASPASFEGDEEARERTESAIELYMLSHFEPNPVPRFLLQCAALEVLAPRGELKPAHIVALVDAWKKQAQAMANDERKVERNDEKKDLNQLAGDIGRLKTISHSERIRRFARKTLKATEVPNVDHEVKRLIDAYGVRSNFLHEGKRRDLERATLAMHDILPVLLKAVLK